MSTRKCLWNPVDLTSIFTEKNRISTSWKSKIAENTRTVLHTSVWFLWKWRRMTVSGQLCREVEGLCFDTDLFHSDPSTWYPWGSDPHEFTPHSHVYVVKRSPRSTHSSLMTWPQTWTPALWLCDGGVRGNVIIYRAQKPIQGDECRPLQRSWPRSPLAA